MPAAQENKPSTSTDEQPKGVSVESSPKEADEPAKQQEETSNEQANQGKNKKNKKGKKK